jgi:uncharacterized protein (TIGR00369 family)
MEPYHGVVDREVLRQQSGLDFLRGIIDGRFPAAPIAALIGFRLTRADPGLVTFESTPEFRHYNPIGTVHGGFMATLLDSCMACAVQTTLAPGQGYTSLEIKVNFVRALTEAAGPLRAIGKVLHAGRRQGTAEGSLLDAQDKLYAHGTTTCMIFPI